MRERKIVTPVIQLVIRVDQSALARSVAIGGEDYPVGERQLEGLTHDAPKGLKMST